MIAFLSCVMQNDTINYAKQSQVLVKKTKDNIKEKIFKGWWIYGEGQHIFKDELTLKEYNLEFLNEDPKDLHYLYLAVCEMEYFPLESNMTGFLRKDIVENQDILVVTDFEIDHVEGCGE